MPGPPPPGLRLAGVGRTYPGRGRRAAPVVALEGVDLEAAAGEFVAVIGPSGCGKSTLLRIVAGLDEASTGTVEVLGTTPGRAAAAKAVGLVPQAPALLPWRSVEANVRLPAEVNRGAGPATAPEPRQLLAAVGLADVADRHPAELSGGMRQRVAIARAFALEPRLLLMDEPFSALDELTRERLRHLLLEVWQAHRATVLFVTHSVTEAVTLADRVVVMSPRPGRIRASVEVDLPRPRPEGVELGDAHRDLERRVRGALRDGGTGG